MIFNRVYEIDWNTIALNLLPRAIRKPKFYAWFKALFKPSENLHTSFRAFRRQSNYKIDHTPQVFSIEKVLNDAFDQQLRRIYIQDGVYLEALYFYNPEENSPVHFYNESDKAVRFYSESELLQLDVDFVVVLPATFENVNSEMAFKNSPMYLRIVSLIDTYRLPDKTYEIILK